HSQILELAKSLNFDEIITVGPHFKEVNASGIAFLTTQDLINYLTENEIVKSDARLLEGLSQSLRANNHPHSIGVTWTTDAPFRETKSQVSAYQNRGILAVDMEAAAVLAVAESNSRSGLAAFSISDSLADGKWSMSKDLMPAQNGLFILFESLMDFLSK
ncbi:MAG: hypothetical protein ACK40V_09135, partial [Anaerolineales bacterium]